MAHKHSVYDTDLHFAIDPITRKITTECKKTQLMQKDHNSERFTFEIPRYIEGHDMSLCNVVQIHYINTNSTNKQEQVCDIYNVDDLQLSPDSEDIVIGSWLISSNATTYSGTLNFVIRFACVDEETKEIEYQWFTDIYSAVSIAKTICNIEASTGGESTDILEKWKEEISKASYESTLEMMKPVIDAKADSSTVSELQEKVNGIEDTVNTKADSSTVTELQNQVNGIEGTVSTKADSSTVSELQKTLTGVKNVTDNLGALASKSIVLETDLDLPLQEKVNAASEGNHAHLNKEVLDAISEERVSEWDSKADSSTVYELQETVNGIKETVNTKADSSIVSELQETVNTKADSSTVSELQKQVNEIPIIGTATTDKAGIIKPDGNTITVDEDGIIHGANTYELPAATTDTLGGVKPDGNTITVDEDGTIRAYTDSELLEDSTNPVQNKVVKSNIDTLQREVDNLKKSVSDGKTSVANAITAKGVTTATDATFATMAGNISKITTGVDTSDATATESMIVSGKTAYSNGVKVTGNLGTSSIVTDLFRSTPTELSVSRYLIAGASVGNYAIFAGGKSGNSHLANVDAYDNMLVRSTPTELSTSRSDLEGASVGNYAIFAGGKSGNSYSASVDAYDASLVRSTPTELSVSRYYLAGASVGNYAIFAGGFSISSISSIVDAYDASLVRSTPTGLSKTRSAIKGASVGNYAIFAGGNAAIAQVSPLSNIDAYNTSLVRSTTTGLSEARFSAGGTDNGNYAIFAGGQNSDGSTATVDAYNASLTRITPTKLSVNRIGSAGARATDYAIFAGGYSSSSNGGTDVVDVYTPSLVRKNVTYGSNMLKGAYNLAGASVGNYAIFAGGRIIPGQSGISEVCSFGEETHEVITIPSTSIIL